MQKISFDGTWDIETENWDKFVMGGIHADGQTSVHHNEGEYFDALMGLAPGTYWAHNAGRFDSLWLIEMLLKRKIDWTGALRGSSVIEVAVDGKRFRDSYAVFPEKLAIVAQAGGARKHETGLPCTCSLECVAYCSRQGVTCKCPKTCGGYCSIKRRMPAAQRAKLSDYLVADCEGLQSGLKALEAYCARSGVELRPTIGASAWNTCSSWIGLDRKSPAHTLAMYKRLRAGYYGGRNEVYGISALNGNRYDIHSCYPAALSAIALPIGELRSANPAAAYARGLDGIYDARVFVPECHSPPLPMRTSDRLVYCHGPLTGTWTGIELRHAEAMGAQIVSIDDAVYCERSERVLKPYADRVWALREDAKINENDAIYRWVKWLANSLTGKLAMSPSVVTLACVDEDAGMKPGETRILHKHGRIVVARETARVGSCAHVEWAAHLTSFARGPTLHRQLANAGDDALYCDTDSVYTRGTLTENIGPNLGEWGHEGGMSEWTAIAPKVYRYWNGEKYVTRGKGMSRLTPVGFDTLARGGKWGVEGVRSFKTAVQKKEGVFKRNTLSREIKPQTEWMGSRRVVGNRTESVTFEAYELARAGAAV